MKTVVFCDFDGTITVTETFVALLKHFAPEVAADQIPRMYAKEVPLREGVRRILESIDADRLPAIAAFGADAAVREGFDALLDSGVDVVVVTGGLETMVRAVLGDRVERLAGLHGVQLRAEDGHVHVVAEHEGESELVDKASIIAGYAVDRVVCIGDSLTDLGMAHRADVVFARDRLAAYLTEDGVPFHAWTDFHDVVRFLNGRP